MARRRTPSILTALNASLKAAPPAKADEAVVALAKRYALELDDSAAVSRQVLKSLEKLRKQDIDQELLYELSQLASRIEEVHVAGIIGPKFQSALAELGLTPAARKAVAAGGGGNAGNKPSSKLDELRERRERRT